MTYLRFLYEKDMDKENLEKIVIDKPIYICGLPRSGTTFLHTLMCSNPQAKGIRMYEHFLPGSKTMTKESRLKLAEILRQGLSNNDNKDFNSVHEFKNIMNYEEELGWKATIGLNSLSFVNIPRLEAYRSHFFERDYTYVYNAIIDEMKMSAVEFPVPENGYFCMKCADHFMTPELFLNIQCKDEYHPRIIWLHREIIPNLRSSLVFHYCFRSAYEGDIGYDDIEWLKKTIVDIRESTLRKSIEEREKWIKENPERAQWICDVSFTELITNPIGTCKKIYTFFDMEWNDQLEHSIMKSVEYWVPQRIDKSIKDQFEQYYYNDDEIRTRFNFYYEKFKEYLPNW